MAHPLRFDNDAKLLKFESILADRLFDM